MPQVLVWSLGAKPVHEVMGVFDRFACLDDEPEEGPEGSTDRQNEAGQHGELSVLDSFAAAPGAQRDRPAAVDWDMRLQVSVPDTVRRDMVAAAAPALPARCETRGRKRGSTAHETALRRLLADSPGPAPAVAVTPTRQEQQSAAGRASAQRRREQAAAGAREAEPACVNFAAEECRALVPFAAEAAGQSRTTPLFEQERLQQTLSTVRPEAEKRDTKLEAGILGNYLQTISKGALAKRLKTSSKTLTRSLRLLAFCIVMVRRGWALQDFHAFDSFLFLHFGDDAVKRMTFILKYKFDEMSMRLKVQTAAGVESAIAKLLQVCVNWVAMWKVRDTYVRMKWIMPRRIKPIESCTIPVVRAALDHFTTMPDKSRQFESLTRMPVADQHASNNGASETYSRDRPEEVRHGFDCIAHIEARVGLRAFDVFPSEKRGLLHCTLACNFGGALLQVKAEMKKEFRDHMTWHDSAAGAGLAAQEYREQVFAACCDPTETSDKKSRQAKVILYFARRRIHNGRLRKRRGYEHFCRNRRCCRDREHCCQQFDKLVDAEFGPQQWCTQRWSGMEDCADFVIYYILFNDMFEIVFIQVFTGTPQAGPGAPSAARLEDGADANLADGEGSSDDEPSHLPEQDLDLPDPCADETYDKKQSTCRANGVVWLKSKPAGRLVVFRMLIKWQQVSLRTVAKDASLKQKKAELQRRLAGKPPQYRVVMAAEGRYTKEPMRKWSEMLREESAWATLLQEYRNHELSTHAFRGASALLCATHELQCIILEDSFPVRGYMLLSKKAAGTDVLTAAELIRIYEEDPCILCHFWYNHCKKYPTVQKMCSPDSTAEVALHADEADLDNIDVETNNTLIHRSIRRCLQQKLANIFDVGAQFAMHSDRQVHTQLLGDRKYPAGEITDKPNDGRKKMKGGGGGLARAFVSAHASLVRTPEGKIDFAEIWSMYRHEKSLAHSPLLESLKDRAKLATAARRQQFQQGKRASMSSFGGVKTRFFQQHEREKAVRALRNSLAESSDHGAAAAGDLQIVPFSGAEGYEHQLQVHAGQDIDKQISLLRAVSRQEAKERRAAELKEESALRKHMAETKDCLYDVDFKELQNEFAVVRTFRSGPILDVHVHRDACSFVQQRASAMAHGSKESKAAVKSCVKLWATEHELLTSAASPPQDTVPISAKISFCCKHGAGSCLCKGRGYVARLGAHRVGEAICRRSPKSSKLRALLKSAWIVVEVANRWFHIGLQYFRPRRPTFLELELLPGEVWGCRHVRPLYDSAGLAKPMTAYAVFRQLDLRESLEMHLYKLVTFDRALPSWRPDRLLLVKPLDEFIEGLHSVAFWRGQAAELAADEEKRRKAALAAARARERGKQSGAPKEKRPRTANTPARSEQHEAVKARRAQSAEHQALLLPLPAPPTDSGTERLSDDDLFGEESDIEDLGAGRRAVLDSSDSDLDVLLSTLKEGAEGATSKAGKAGAKTGTVGPDWLDELDEEEVFGPEELPSFKVRKRPDPGDSPSGSSISYTPTDGPSETEAGDEGDSATEGDRAKPTPESRGRAPRARGGPRGKWTHNRDNEQPNGCVCRKYEPAGETPYWYGELPEGIVDSKGLHTRKQGFRDGLRSEATALAIVEAWLHIHSEGAADPTEAEAQSDDDESDGSSSSGSTSS